MVSLKRIALAVLVLGLLSGAAFALSGPSSEDQTLATARVMDPEGRELGVMVNGRFRPSPKAVDGVRLVPCRAARDQGPLASFCRDGFYFANIFEYRKYVSAKRALSRFTGPVIIEVGGRRNHSYLEDGWLR